MLIFNRLSLENTLRVLISKETNFHESIFLILQTKPDEVPIKFLQLVLNDLPKMVSIY